jgi:Protein of unknown function (DUF1285)
MILWAQMAAKITSFRKGNPPPGYVDTEIIRLTREGIWIADGHEISHEPTVALFARSLAKDEVGYFLHIGFEMKRIEVEDTAYFVTGLSGTAAEGYEVKINDGTLEKLIPETLEYLPGRLTCVIKSAEGTPEPAKFLKAPYIEILRDLQKESDKYFLVIQGKRIDLAVSTHEKGL